MNEYWIERIASSLEEHGVAASPDQVQRVAGDVAAAHELAHMYTGNPGPVTGLTPEERRVNELERQLAEERRKVICTACDGTGRLIFHGVAHQSSSKCDVCFGVGRVK